MTDPIQTLRNVLNDWWDEDRGQANEAAAASALTQVENLVRAAQGLHERVEMDESVGICLSTRAESLLLGDALAPFKDTP